MRVNTNGDALLEMLLVDYPNTHLPELYTIFGKEAFIKFLDIFAGTRISVPTRDEIEESSRNHAIYKAWKKDATIARSAAEVYGLPFEQLNLMLNKLQQKYESAWMRSDEK